MAPRWFGLVNPGMVGLRRPGCMAGSQAAIAARLEGCAPGCRLGCPPVGDGLVLGPPGYAWCCCCASGTPDPPAVEVFGVPGVCASPPPPPPPTVPGSPPALRGVKSCGLVPGTNCGAPDVPGSKIGFISSTP